MFTDLLNSFVLLLSLIKGQNVAATLTGDYVDCEGIDGPVFADVGTGTATGTPDTQSSTFTLMEADSSGGSGAQAIANQSSAVVITTDKGKGCIRGVRTKRYVAVKNVLAFTGGSTPKQDSFGTIRGEKKRL